MVKQTPAPLNDAHICVPGQFWISASQTPEEHTPPPFGEAQQTVPSGHTAESSVDAEGVAKLTGTHLGRQRGPELFTSTHTSFSVGQSSSPL